MLPARSFTKARLNQWPALAVVVLLYLFVSAFANEVIAADIAQKNTLPAQAKAKLGGAQDQSAAVEKSLVEVEGRDKSEARQSVGRYSKRIDELESEFGAYDNRFSEALLDLGLAQQEIGNHDDAIKTLKQALHVNRINEGLYNPNIAPILERLIFSHASAGDWEAVDDRHHFLMQLSYQTLRPDDPALLPVLTKLSRWHLYAFIQNIDANPLKHLVAARSLFNRAASIIELNFGNSDLRLAHQYNGRTIADYYLTVYQQQNLSQESYDGPNGKDESAKKVVHIQNGFGEGLRAIKSSIAVYANNEKAPPEAQALALAQLGDWYLMFRKNQSADEAYTQAYTMLAADPAFAKVLDSTFGRPVPLPDFNNAYFDYFEETDKQEEMGYVLVNVNITASGGVRKARVIDASPAKKSMRRRALTTLKSTVFRPRFENGVAVATQDLRYRYRFEYKPEKTAEKDDDHD